jgi:hypothetical protein
MDAQQLRSQLKQLHAELSTTPAVDAETRALLHSLIQDAQQILERQREPSAGQPVVSTRFKDAVEQFEARHPQLTWTLAQISDTLSRMGF